MLQTVILLDYDLRGLQSDAADGRMPNDLQWLGTIFSCSILMRVAPPVDFKSIFI